MMKLKHCFYTIVLAVVLGSCPGGGSSTDEYAARMQKFVKDISAYARSINPNFIIVPQNGEELAFNNTEPDEGILWSYINAIDGIGIEELFYDTTLNIDNDRLGMLRRLKAAEPRIVIMVSDYANDTTNAILLSKTERFIAFPRKAGNPGDNYDYKIIPALADGDNSPIGTLADAKNYLYLISDDNFTIKGDMITAIQATKYDVVLIDLFFKGTAFTASEINSLKTKSGGGSRLVIAYISIGSAEKYRDYWKSEWKQGSPSWIKKKYDGYGDEFWVEFWHPEWQRIIFGNQDSYIKQIIDAGFDGAYLDNVEAYYSLLH